jgi:type II secretory pathway pseudopilin PulG
MTLTPIHAHVTTKAQMTTTEQQLSKNGELTKPTLAPKPTGPAVAPRLIGAKTIAEVQQLKKERERAELQRITEYIQQTQKIIREGKQVQFDPKKEICQGPQNIAQAPEKYFCLGTVIPKTFTEKQRECLALARSVSSKGPASHSSLRVFTAMECLPSP